MKRRYKRGTVQRITIESKIEIEASPQTDFGAATNFHYPRANTKADWPSRAEFHRNLN